MQQTFGFIPERPNSNLRVVVTGQVGVDKKPFLLAVADHARKHGHQPQLDFVGDMMYREAPDVAPGRILDLPLGRLRTLRRSVFKDILARINTRNPVIVSTHAAFRWRHGLFPAFDHDLMQSLNADIYITLVDNVDALHERLDREHVITHSLKDVLVWREEEILATEVLASATRGHGTFYIVARNMTEHAIKACYRLIFDQRAKKVYPSFPMTHVAKLPDTQREIDEFRTELAKHFITFDPGDVDEKFLLSQAVTASERGESTITRTVNGRVMEYDVREIFSVAKDIDAQIYARDFKLIDQSDMIVSFIPELPDGRPALSSGVERELQHAHEGTREVYVIWKPKAQPSPFVTATATRMFSTVEALLDHFRTIGYITADSEDMPERDSVRAS